MSLILHRLGSSPDDAQEVMAHRFFSPVNWKDMIDKKVKVLLLDMLLTSVSHSQLNTSRCCECGRDSLSVVLRWL